VTAPRETRPAIVIATIGVLQILAWGSSFYLLGVLAPAIAKDTGWPLPGIVGGLSTAFLLAGLMSPRVGRTIKIHGGRPVLAVSSLAFAAGLALLAVAPAFPVYIVAWVLMGLGMGAGLYDPAFATLGRHYGPGARTMITAVTLFGGFASTVCWPVSAALLAHFGWRNVCWFYVALHLLIGLPAYWLLLPKAPPKTVRSIGLGGTTKIPELPPDRHFGALLLLGGSLTIGAATLSLVSMHLLTLLQGRGYDLASAVALGTLVGPSQVAARLGELTIGRHYHPVWAMLAGALLVATGMLFLLLGWNITALALIAYGAGNGISSIVRGTVPLVLFGPSRYAVLMGRLGLPILFAMAAAPAIGALLVEHGGASLTFAAVLGAACVNVGLVLILVWWCADRSLASVHDCQRTRTRP
jgi:predicted MFS family arabinose efflux permease